MKRKGLTVLLVLLLIVGTASCTRQPVDQSGSSDVPAQSVENETRQDTESEKKQQQSASEKDPLTADELSISLFEWDVREEVIKKALGYRLTLRNGCSYPVLSTDIIYKTKETATDEELKQFDQFKKKNKKYIDPDEDNRNIILIGQSDAYIKPNQYLQNLPITIGVRSMTWFDTPNYDQFILMRPDSLSLGLVKNNTLYHCHYDFTSKTWTVDPETESLNVWPDNRLAKLIPEPSCDYYLVSTKEDDSYLRFTVYGISKKEYQSYVDSVKEQGFSLKINQGKNYYSAEDRKKNSVDILYDTNNWNMSVNVNL